MHSLYQSEYFKVILALHIFCFCLLFGTFFFSLLLLFFQSNEWYDRKFSGQSYLLIVFLLWQTENGNSVQWLLRWNIERTSLEVSTLLTGIYLLLDQGGKWCCWWDHLLKRVQVGSALRKHQTLSSYIRCASKLMAADGTDRCTSSAFNGWS